MSQRALQISLGGTAVVCCIHDVEKEQITTEAQIAAIGLQEGFIYNPLQHKIHRCTCCGNLFADFSDLPIYCNVCKKSPVHIQMGPLPEPEGVL